MKKPLCVLLFFPLLVCGQSPNTSVVVQTVAGSGTPGYLDGVGVQTFLSSPTKIVVGKSGEIYFYDQGTSRMRKITADLTVSTLAGNGQGAYRDGETTNSSFGFLRDMVQDSESNLIVVDYSRIRKITPTGLVTTIAGSQDGYRDGHGNDALFNQPRITIDQFDTLFIADSINHRIRRMDKTGEVTTIAGSDAGGDSDGVGIFASFWYPTAIAVDLAGNILVFDQNKFRQIDTSGKISTRVDLQALVTSYSLATIDKLLIDSVGSIYIATASRI